MIKLGEWSAIRQLYEQGYGKRRIARMLGVSRNTVRKALEIPRLKPRHGTTRTLNVLSLALMAITNTFMLTFWDLVKVLIELLGRLRQPEVFTSALIA